jgi:hypothetical protein
MVKHRYEKRKTGKSGKRQFRRAPKIERFDYTRPLPNVEVPKAVIDDILAKKELLVSPEFATHIVLRYLRKQPGLITRLSDPKFLRSAEYEKMKKWVRQELRVLVGMFVLDADTQELVQSRTNTILASHRSTAERLPHYPGLYDALFGEWKPKAVLDLCAGLNPCAYEYLGCTPVYYAFDVSPQLMSFVNVFFRTRGIEGKAVAADVTTITEFPDVDTMMIFKGMDVLERDGFGEELLDRFRDKRIIVSFATATISGAREIKVSKRSWVERWAEKTGRSVRTHDIPGERFYIIE